MTTIRRVHDVDERRLAELTDVLIDCVEGGASVSFMHPLTRERAERRVADGVAAGARALLVAEDARGVCGTVQLVLDLPENQPHRADLAKLFPRGGYCSTTVFYRDLREGPPPHVAPAS